MRFARAHQNPLIAVRATGDAEAPLPAGDGGSPVDAGPRGDGSPSVRDGGAGGCAGGAGGGHTGGAIVFELGRGQVAADGASTQASDPAGAPACRAVLAGSNRTL
ncbi:MAG: hypothetical protein EXR76_16190 [Myxococcales bacterium]|nr:hypothetical protein [Myxococcales bacterium]